MLPSSQRSSPLMRSSAALIASRCSWPRRSAASAADFGLEDAAQLEQPLHVLRRSSASRRRCGSTARCSGASTKAPMPCRASIMPSARNCAIASRTTLRLTPNFSDSCCSVGSRAARVEVAGLDLAAEEGRDAVRQRLDGADGGQSLLHEEVSVAGRRQPGFISPLRVERIFQRADEPAMGGRQAGPEGALAGAADAVLGADRAAERMGDVVEPGGDVGAPGAGVGARQGLAAAAR